MKSRLLSNIALMGLVILLGIFIYNTDTEDEVARLSSLDADSIVSIEIRHRDRYVVLKKTADRWQMTKPIGIRANDFRISNLLGFLNAATNATYAADSIDLSRFKLDQPRTSIRFSNNEQEAFFEFGAANPINRMRYVRAGSEVYLIDDNFYPLVSSQIGTLIDHKLFPDEVRITQLQIPGHAFSRDDQGWTLQPDDDRLSSDDINRVIDNWANATAFGVHDFMPRAQLGDVRLRYELGGQASEETFVVTDTDPWLILARPALGIEYHFDISLYDELFSPGHLQDRDILDTEQAILEAESAR